MTNTDTELRPHLPIEDTVQRLELSLEGLLKLLGGTPEDRERFWEILKGITSRADFTLVASGLEAARAQLDAAAAVVKGVHAAAGQIRG